MLTFEDIIRRIWKEGKKIFVKKKMLTD